MTGTSQFRRVLWLANLIYSKERLTATEIDYYWSMAPINETHEKVYSRRQLIRDKDSILQTFGIEIACERGKGKGIYYVTNASDIKQEEFRSWLLNSFSVQFMLNENHILNSRILFEQVPSGHRYLTTIMQAMLDGISLSMTYQGFRRDTPHTFLVSPYCLKVFKQRWYMVGQSNIYQEPRIYSLDRIHELTPTSETYTLPKGFNAKEYFKDYYGTERNIEVPVEEVIVRTNAMTANYIRTLPLHASQKETITENGSVFTFHVAPTFDFVQELRTQGSTLEVIAPQWLRQQFLEEALKTAKLYESL